MKKYNYADDQSGNIEWEDEFAAITQQFEKSSERQLHNRKLHNRRRSEDYQEKRRLRKRTRIDMDGWD